MENKKIILNMKMYMDITDVFNFLNDINTLPNNVIVCPEMIYLPYFANKNYNLALQNIYPTNEGAFTGEVSAQHAFKMGVNYVVVGHSERRKYFNESDEQINEKLLSALNNKLKVILCIGESLEDYELGKTIEVLKKQIEICLKNVEQKQEYKITVAYEPVWAIGTGKVPTNEEIDDTVKKIKEIILDLYNLKLEVVYGGSVSSKNIETLNTIESIDGFMVGGASTNPDEVKKMIKVVNN